VTTLQIEKASAKRKSKLKRLAHRMTDPVEERNHRRRLFPADEFSEASVFTIR
jgi:hypothetical protein